MGANLNDGGIKMSLSCELIQNEKNEFWVTLKVSMWVF